MAGWWKRVKEKARTEMTSSSDYKSDESALDRYARRLSEVEEELAELGKFLEELDESANERFDPSASEQETYTQVTEKVYNLRIPAFCAIKLAEEGLALLNLIAVRIASLRSIYEQSTSSPKLQKLADLKNHVDEVEPILRKTLDDLAPYSTLDARKIIESVCQRITTARKPGDKG